MFEKLRAILNRVEADYADIRYEVKKDAVITFNSKELTAISSNTTDGYVLRVLVNGGMSSVVFTKVGDAENAMRIAEENAKLIARNIDKPIKLAATEVIKDTFIPTLKEDPRNISMDEKLELAGKYNDIPLSHEKVVSTTLSYKENIREKYFLNSEGSEIREDLITVSYGGEIAAKDGSLLQNVRVGFGGSNGFSTIRNQEQLIEKRTGIVLDLLKAKPVKGGVYNCVVNPSLSGVFAHEAFGHFSEADIIEKLPAMRAKMKIGDKLGSDITNIKDDATMPDQLGFYKYDDEGVRVRPTQLMKNGVLTGRLHSRRTAVEFDEPLSGHSIAEDYKYAPIIRMGNIFIEPAEHSFDGLVAMLGDGLYILDAKGGQTAGENFTFGAQYGFIVKNGKVGEMVRDINISGNLYQTLANIAAVGNDLELTKVGGCGKGQLNIRSCHGGPHTLINKLVVGGV
ncbi:MAG: TldD/PmbA family protein [candidate division Zixibacteria bacterium]|nr:TldD/PmbA family protein [candidate division Zixibacteria bacterium]